MIRAAIIALAISLPIAACQADPAPQIHYAPSENLEHIDVELIDGTRHEIDMAAYVLTDVAVMDALLRAADRSVQVRIILYETGIPYGYPARVWRSLKATPTVEIRVVPSTRPLMHLKAYQVDGKTLRTGSANFSASGLKQQANDLVVIESAPAAQRFREQFDRIWKDARP